MTWLDGYRMRLVFVGLVAGIALGSGTARGDFFFGEPTKLGALINTPYDDLQPSISADGWSLYFSSTRPGGYGGAFGDIWVAMREKVNDPWGMPVNLGPKVNSSYTDSARISPDGLTLFIDSDRPGGYGGYDIWIATRETLEDDWGSPVNPGETVNSLAHEQAPSVTADGLELYFSGWISPFRPGGHGHADLWMTTRPTKDDPWEKPRNLGALVNSSSQDARPCISADGLVLFFDSQRPGGYGYGDLYMTTRASRSDPWGRPVNLGPTVNSSAFEELPYISADGRTLYLDRANASNWSDGSLWQLPIIPIVDFTGNGQVDIDDLLILIEHWGQNEPAYDIGPMPWGDGVIDKADLEVLMSYGGQDIYDPHLLAHWKLDETEADVAYDSAGVNDATITGDVTWEPENGKINGALQLDGADDYIQTPYIIDPAHGILSALLWIKGGVPGQVILSQENGANWLMIDTEGRLATEFKLPGMSMPFVSGAVITDGDWHRMGVVWDGTNRLLYVDGVQVLNESGIRFRPSQGGLHIGAGSDLEPVTFFSGMIDDVRIYDRVVAP